MDENFFWAAVGTAFLFFILLAVYIVIGVVIGYAISVCLDAAESTTSTMPPIINWCVGIFAALWYAGGLMGLLLFGILIIEW